MFSVRSLTALLFAFVIMLAIVWPIPNELLPFHRNFLLYCSFVFALGLVIKNVIRPPFWQGHIRWVSLILLAITVLGLITGLLFSPDVKLMFKHWNSMWVRPVMLFFLGLYIYPVLKHSFTRLTPEKFISIIVLCFCVSPILHILNILWLWHKTGAIEWGETVLFRTRTELSIQINMVAVMLVAEALRRMLRFQPVLVFSHWLLGGLIALSVFATMLANTRFGTLGFAAGMVSMLFLILIKEINRKNMRKLLAGLSLLLIVVVSLAYSSWQTDPRWKTLVGDMQTGWNAPTSSFCFELGYDDALHMERQDGSTVDGSNTCRPAYMHQAIELVKDHPQGNGAGKDLYRQLLQKKFNNDRITISQSHSGLLEFALQYGVAGLLLWLSFNAVIIRQAWHSYTRENDALSLFLLIFTIGFLSRSVVDRNLIDHFFEQFMFVTGVLLSITWIKDHQKN